MAEAFLKRKILQRQAEAKEAREPVDAPKTKMGKTKEELAEIRKQMMKRRPATAVQPTSEPSLTSITSHPKDELMSRLAKGEKVQVSKDEMLKLTSKNYDLLPEVVQRKKEQAKKQEFKDRMRQVKELEQKRREMTRK